MGTGKGWDTSRESGRAILPNLRADAVDGLQNITLPYAALGSNLPCGKLWVSMCHSYTLLHLSAYSALPESGNKPGYCMQGAAASLHLTIKGSITNLQDGVGVGLVYPQTHALHVNTIRRFGRATSDRLRLQSR